ncbi:alpha/beta hydrolase [Novosphingobium ginsenosidimutans]
MRKSLILSLGAIALIGTTIAQAAPGDRLRERLKERMESRQGGSGERRGAQRDADAPRTRPDQTFAYGSDRLQQLDFYKAKGAAGPAPLVIFVHGGGWKRGSKDVAGSRYAPAHYTGLGYNYAAINYRLVPEATVEQQAADVAQSVRALLDRARELGIDRSKVVLTGHSAGAHLVALVGTDEQYLRSGGLSFRDLAGVMPNDGAAYDVAAQMKDGGPMMQDTYVQAFGTDPVRQRALSPTLQAAAPNAPRFLLIHVQRQDGVAQAKALEAALRQGGTTVERREFEGRGLQGHAEINRQLGNPDYPATAVVDAWLKSIFGR